MDLKPSPRTIRFAVALIAAIVATVPADRARADDAAWLVRVEPLYIDVQGHDPHVLDVRSGAGGVEAVDLQTESGVGYHFELRRDGRGRWGWGLDFFWFTGTQDTAPREGSGTAGAPLSFDIAEGGVASSSPDEVIFFQRREDTDMNAWTADFYATRRLSADPDGSWRLLFGLRNADFDNDNRSVVGFLGVGGTRVDASSNYSRMIGPLVGVVGERAWGRARVEAVLTQSVVQGDIDLSASQSDYLGAFVEESEDFTAVRSFSRSDTASISITDLRLRWTWSVSRSLAFGLGANVSHWSGVPVPPGVSPSGNLDTLAESSITFTGLLATVEVDF